jgi:outer membrane protein TolC
MLLILLFLILAIPTQAQTGTTRPPTAPPEAQTQDPRNPPDLNPPVETVPPNQRPAQSPPLQRVEPVPPRTQSPTVTDVPGQGTDAVDAPPNIPRSEPLPVPPLPSLNRVGIESDNTLSLTLHEAIRLAITSNNDIEVARQDVRFAETVLHSLEGVYDPIFSITPEINYSQTPTASTLSGSSTSGTVTQTDYLFTPQLTKQFARGGGNYQFFFSNLRRSTNSRFNQLNPFYSGNMGITFTQPLLRDFTIDRNRREIFVQKRRLQQSDADFRRRTSEVISQVQRAYWDLVFNLRDQQNRVANLNLAREQFRITEARIGAGAAAPIERAEVQTELANREAELLLSLQNVAAAENNLKILIFGDPLSPQWSAAIQPTDQPNFDLNPVNLDNLLREARSNRPELSRLNLQQEINNIDIRYYRNQSRPRIDLQSTISSTGLAGNPINPSGSLGGPSTLPPNVSGGYSRMLRNIFDFDTKNVSVGVSIQLPLRNRTAEANLAGARIQKEQLGAMTRAQEQLIEVEVRNAAQAVETARQRVLTARNARQYAEVQLAGERRLYQVGRSTTYLLFQRENQLTNSRNLELRAETDYNKAIADLQEATSTNLALSGIVIKNQSARLP